MIHEPNPAWTKKAKAFVIRSHGQLWGKNNEDPLAWFFLQGFKNAFIKEIYLGWNKHGQERFWEDWGLSPEKNMEQEYGKRLMLPSGLVIPFIRDKKVLKVTICRHDKDEESLVVPGSCRIAMILGNNPARVEVVPRPMDALLLHQETGEASTVMVPHPGDTPLDDPARTLLENSNKIRVFIHKKERDKTKLPWIKNWMKNFPQATLIEYPDRKNLVNSGGRR